MADIATPYGLKPVKTITGATWTAQNTTSSRTIESGYNTNIFIGDPVTLVGGYIERYTPGGADLIYGVFNGCTYYDASGKPTPSGYWPAGTVCDQDKIVANVVDDPNVLYLIQSNATPGLPQTSLLKNANLIAGTGSVSTQKSGFSLNQATVTAGAPGTDHDLKIYALGQQIGQEWAVSGPGGLAAGYNNVLVLLNNTMLRAPTAAAN
jgi:hypothetical protein